MGEDARQDPDQEDELTGERPGVAVAPGGHGTGPASGIAAGFAGSQIDQVPETAPKTVGKYQITDLLGKGAMGVVYRALDPLLGRYVAVKVMSQGIASDQELRDRFLREARAAGSLQHPNIITIYDFGEAEGSLYIAMEYVEGSDLSEIMERRDPLPLTGKIDIVVDALHALDYAHSRGVVHRDVKPANIRVSVDGRAKLMDFGIARLEKSDLTKSGMMIGTPSYMAPEQVTGGAITPATDVFAIGAVLYEFLVNRATFPGDTMHAVLYKVVSEQPPPLRDVAAALPPSLQPIVDRALAKDPRHRYPTAGAMARDLESVRVALSGGATVRVAARATPLRTTIRAEALRVRKRRRRLAWLGAGAGVVVLAAVSFLIIGGHRLRQAGAGAAAPQPAATGLAPTSRGGDSGVANAQAAPDSNGVSAMPAPGAAASSAPGTAARKARLGGARPAPASSSPRRPNAPVVTTAGGAPGEAAAPQPTPSAPAAVPATRPLPTPAAPQPAAPSAPQPSSTGAQPAPNPPAAEAPVDPTPQLASLVAAYAHAIESKSIDEMRRVYPGLSAEQETRWRTLFQAARDSVKAQLVLARFQVTGSTAAVEVTGHLEYDVGAGTQKPQVGFSATAVLERGAWTFKVIP